MTANNDQSAVHRALRALPLLILAGVLSACGGSDASDDGAAAAEQAEDGAGETDDDTRAIPVEVATVERGEIYAAYSGTASLEAFEEAEVVAKVEGQVEAILVEEGDFVRAGQVLARLDGDRLRLRLEEARANLAKAEREYARNVELHQKGIVAPGAFENIKYEMDALRAAFNSAKLEYDYATIRAPIDGVIAARMIKVGNTIPVNTPCFHIADLQPIVAYLHVPEREFGKISAGQPVDATVDALRDRRFRGVVARISPLVDAQTGTFKATIEMDPNDTALKPGMFARVNIIYDARANAVLIPRAAVMETELGSSVFVVNESAVTRREIETGFGWQDRVEVVRGVDEGETIVIVGQAGLKEGSVVEVIGVEPARDSGVANTPDEVDDPDQTASKNSQLSSS